MQQVQLTVQKRLKTGKGISRQLRRQGLVPGVCYGQNCKQPINVSVDPLVLKKSLDPERRKNSIIDLSIADGDKVETKMAVMVRDFQIDAIRRKVTHVDFVAIDFDKAIISEVPVVLSGKPKGISLGGTLEVRAKSIKVKSKPRDIPVNFVLDISPLGIDEQLVVGDIQPPQGVAITSPNNTILAVCAAGRKEATAAAAGDDKDDAKADDKK